MMNIAAVGASVVILGLSIPALIGCNQLDGIFMVDLTYKATSGGQENKASYLFGLEGQKTPLRDTPAPDSDDKVKLETWQERVDEMEKDEKDGNTLSEAEKDMLDLFKNDCPAASRFQNASLSLMILCALVYIGLVFLKDNLPPQGPLVAAGVGGIVSIVALSATIVYPVTCGNPLGDVLEKIIPSATVSVTLEAGWYLHFFSFIATIAGAACAFLYLNGAQPKEAAAAEEAKEKAGGDVEMANAI